MPAIIDTSAILALLRTAEPMHAAVASAVAAERGAIVVPLTVVVEAAQIIGRRLGPAAESTWLISLVRSAWQIESAEITDLERAAELMDRYRDADIGFVDATIVAIAERLGSVRLYTLDRRDLTIIRPRHVTAFELLP